MLKGVIFGLDGTLSDPTHRAHLAQAGAWDDYRDAAPGDTPFPDVADLFRELQGTVPVWVVTGRDEAFRAPTEAWFLRHGLHPTAVLMRPKWNRMRAPELKTFLILEAFGDWERIKAVASFSVDADPKVCEAYRVAGFPCWMPRQGK